MVSDIHFDPFADPGKVKALAAAGVTEWDAILSAPATATQAKDFAAVQSVCKAKAVDTDYALLKSALAAIHTDAAAARFTTVSGDLIAHKFNCRWAAVMPGGTQAEYDAFVEKTIAYVGMKLQQTLPRATLYLALGNNDSNCEDYKLDTDTAFLAALGGTVARGMGAAWTHDAVKEFAVGGYYSVRMAAPMQHTRLIVVNDIFDAPKHTTCGGNEDATAWAAQLQWFQGELAAAKAAHERVWVMGHMPPGVNPYATLEAGPAALCAQGGKGPAMFLADERLGDAIAGSGAQLAIFAHTHMDELRQFGDEVPMKLVGSISPVDGNNPSFTVARVNTATAVVEDYTVYAATDAKGSAWPAEYSFSGAYGPGGFMAAKLRGLTAAFAAGDSAESRAYMRNFGSGEPDEELTPVWPGYVCALTNEHAKEYQGCACAAMRAAMDALRGQ